MVHISSSSSNANSGSTRDATGFRDASHSRSSSYASESGSSSQTGKSSFSSLEVTNNSDLISDKKQKLSLPVNPADGNSTDDSGIDSISSPAPVMSEDIVYSKVTLANKKKNKVSGLPQPQGFPKGKEVENQPSEGQGSGAAVIKLVDGIDIGETSTDADPPRNLTDSNEKKISLETLSKNDISDIYELTTLLNNTTALLTRNSSLRASLTISVKNPKNGKSNEQTFILPSGNSTANGKGGKDTSLTGKCQDVKSAKTNKTSVWEVGDHPSEKPTDKSYVSEIQVDDCVPATESDEFPSLVDLDGAPNPSFVRHNPARRPVQEVKPTSAGGNLPEQVCRRSIRLKPKTVATLASKYDALLYKGAQVSTIPEKEKNLLNKKDITKIIGSLNKLDEDAKRSCYRPKPMTTSSKTDVNNSDQCEAAGKSQNDPKDHPASKGLKSSVKNQRNVSVGNIPCEPESPGQNVENQIHATSENKKKAHFATLQQKPTVHFATVSTVHCKEYFDTPKIIFISLLIESQAFMH